MKFLKKILASRQMGLFAALLVIALGFGFGNADFRDPLNLLDRSRHWVEIGIIAIPMTFIIATGGIDLSVGSLLALSGIVTGLCLHDLQWSLATALLAGIVTGLVGGMLNGFIISLLRVPALVATLATLALYRGLAMGLSQANPIRDLPEAFTDWGSLATLDLGSWSIPQQTLLLLACMAVGGWCFAKSCLGRWVTQIGENPTAARFSAVPVAAVQFTIFALSGLTCGLGSVLQTARFATAHPAAATGLELEVIACVVIGGTRITGGSGSMLGTLLGLLILGLLRFGMDMTGVMQQHQIILIGALVVLTAIFNEWMARRGTRRKPAATLTPIPNLGGIA